ncbi:hypothetical protein ACXYMU_09965 [Pontibacter sp. CAU 1760]
MRLVLQFPPPHQTVTPPTLQQGVMHRVVETLAKDLMERGGVDLSECFVDGSFYMAKTGALQWAKLKRGKGTKSMAVTQRYRSCILSHN